MVTRVSASVGEWPSVEGLGVLARRGLGCEPQKHPAVDLWFCWVRDDVVESRRLGHAPCGERGGGVRAYGCT